jgi:HEAT repeat protein
MVKSIREIKRDLTILLKSGDPENVLRELRPMNARRVINPLLSFLCSGDEELRVRAIFAIGAVVDNMAHSDMEGARVIMRRLMWTLNDESGGIGWGAAEAMAEIMARNGPLAEQYAHMLVSYTDEEGNFLEFEALQRGLLRGLVRLAGVSPDLLRGAVPNLGRYFESEDPILRGLAALLAGLLGADSFRSRLDSLRDDGAEFTFYEGAQISRRTVADSAEEGLSLLRSTAGADSGTLTSAGKEENADESRG